MVYRMRCVPTLAVTSPIVDGYAVVSCTHYWLKCGLKNIVKNSNKSNENIWNYAACKIAFRGEKALKVSSTRNITFFLKREVLSVYAVLFCQI